MRPAAKCRMVCMATKGCTAQDFAEVLCWVCGYTHCAYYVDIIALFNMNSDTSDRIMIKDSLDSNQLV